MSDQIADNQPTVNFNKLKTIVINRLPADTGAPWQLRRKLITAMLKRQSVVFDAGVDDAGLVIGIALYGDSYNSDDRVQLEAKFRQIIDRCTTPM